MSSKRLAISFAAVLVLLAIAGVLELVSLAFSSDAAEDAHAQAPRGTLIDEIVESAQRIAAAPTEEQEQADELVQSGIIASGQPLQPGQAEEIVGRARPYVENVGHIDQRSALPSGCEIVALCVALNAEGFPASPADIANNHLRLGGNYATDYVGSPWSDGCGFTPCIVDAANSWLTAANAPGRAVDLTRSSLSGVLALVDLGYPVVVWTTEGMVSPSNAQTSAGAFRWYSPEHCVVVYGTEGDELLVSDSLAGLVRRNRADFESVYAACGSMALYIEPTGPQAAGPQAGQ